NLEAVDVRLLLRSVGAARCERDRHFVAGSAGCSLDTGSAAEDDEVSERDLLAVGLRSVELGLDALENREDLGQLLRLVGLPVLLRQKADASAVGTTALVRAAEGRGRAPCSRDELSNGQARSQDLHLEGGNVRVVDQR